MRPTRFAAPVIATIAFSLVLTACGQAVAQPIPSETPTPVASPSTDPTPKPTPKPTPSEAPAQPVATPTPKPKPVATPAPAPQQPVVVKHTIPSIARVTADGVNVRKAPSTSAPLLDGERLPDLSPIEVRVDAGQQVRIMYGPVVADGETWYNVVAVGGSDIWIGGDGWIAGRFLEAVSAAEQYPLVVAVSGNGSDATVDAKLPGTAALTAAFAAAPVAGDASCTIAVTLVRTDGRTVTVADETVTNAISVEIPAFEMDGLYQESAGTVGYRIATDCSFAAALFAPMS